MCCLQKLSISRIYVRDIYMNIKRHRPIMVDASFIIVFRLVRDVVANHKTTRYAGAATKVIQKNHLA